MRVDDSSGAVKEGKGGDVADGKDFGEEVGGVDQAGEEDKAEEVLAHPLLQLVETHVYRLGLLRANRRSCAPGHGTTGVVP